MTSAAARDRKPSRPAPIIVVMNGWPLLAEPLEGVRSVGAAKGADVVAPAAARDRSPPMGVVKRRNVAGAIRS
jgi:hypothetical protein